MEENKTKALESAMAQIQKQFGKGAVMKLGDSEALEIDAISTGSMSLDIATGIGGIPKGRIIEVYGPESSGKTTLTLHMIAEAQKNGGTAAFIDAEHALDPTYAKDIGVNTDELIISQPDYGEQALEIADTLIRSGGIDIVVIDSVAALVPKHEIDGAMGDATVGMQARLMSQALRKIAGVSNKTGTSVVFINQIREKIGVMFGCLHGSNTIRVFNGNDSREYTIKEIVEHQIKGNVLCFNEKFSAFEWKPIIDWHYNGEVEKPGDYLEIITESVENNEKEINSSRIVVTRDHMVMTAEGWKEAQNITTEDSLLSKEDLNGYVKVTSIKPLTETDDLGKYDISVKDNHNYLAGNLIVHNSPETTTGGRALKFFSSMRLDVRRIESIKDGSEILGNRTRVKVVKNKVASPFKQAEFDIMYGEGISKAGDVLDCAIEKGIIDKAGSWFSYNSERLGQGKENIKKMLKENPALMEEIELKVRNSLLKIDEDGVVIE